MYASVDLKGVGSDGDDGPLQALDGSVVAGGVGAMDTLADIAAAVVDMAARVLAAAAAAGAGLVHEPAPRIEQLVPLDCALVEDVLIGRLVPGLVVLHEHRPAVHLQPRLEHRHGEIAKRQVGHSPPDALLGISRSLRDRGCDLCPHRRSSGAPERAASCNKLQQAHGPQRQRQPRPCPPAPRRSPRPSTFGSLVRLVIRKSCLNPAKAVS